MRRCGVTQRAISAQERRDVARALFRCELTRGPAEPPPPVHKLPMELLCYIFRRIPATPLIRNISRVCKRWRIAALRSIDQIAATSELFPIQIFSSLTELSINATAPPPKKPRLPSLLTRLVLLEESGCPLGLGSFAFSTPFPALRELSITAPNGGACLIPLIMAGLSSLTLLSIIIFADLSPSLTSTLATVHLPSLRHIRLDVSDKNATPTCADQLYTFLDRHSGALTSLLLSAGGIDPNEGSIAFIPYLDMFSLSLNFSSLTTLMLHSVPITGALLSILLSNCPALCDFETYDVDISSLMSVNPRSLLTSLTSLAMYLLPFRAQNQPLKLLQVAPRLTSMRPLALFYGCEYLYTIAASGEGYRFTGLVISDPRSMSIVLKVFEVCVNLTQVAFMFEAITPYLLPHHTLPKLTYVALESERLPISECTAFLRHFARICPNMDSMQLSLPHRTITDNDVAQIGTLLTEIDASGVRAISLRTSLDEISLRVRLARVYRQVSLGIEFHTEPENDELLAGSEEEADLDNDGDEDEDEYEDGEQQDEDEEEEEEEPQLDWTPKERHY